MEPRPPDHPEYCIKTHYLKCELIPFFKYIFQWLKKVVIPRISINYIHNQEESSKILTEYDVS